MNNTKRNKILLRSFCWSYIAVFVTLCAMQVSLAFFSDVLASDSIALTAANLGIEIDDFQIKNSSGNWSTSLSDWSPGDIREIKFTINNTKYDDVLLTDSLEMVWNDATLDPGVAILYPASMSDTDITTDLNSATPQYAINGTIHTEAGQPSKIIFDLNDGRLNGTQSAATSSDKVANISYKLVFNHASDPTYNGKTFSINLTTTANYYHDPSIAWNSIDTAGPLTLNTAVLIMNDFILHFDANGGIGAPGDQGYLQSPSSTHTFTIPATMPTYNINNVFVGWSTSSSATVADYQPRGQITVNPGTTTLYAVWKNPFELAYENAGKTKTGGYFAMQDMSSSICSAVDTPVVTNEAPEIQLFDNRDNKIYWVAKLADGNCWMTQNLDHDIVTTANFYTSSNTDLNSASTWTAGYATIDASANATATSGVSTINKLKHDAGWVEANNLVQSIDLGNIYYDGTSTAECKTFQKKDCNGALSDTPSTNGDHGHIGNYYNLSAATITNGQATNGTATNSICPANWRLSTYTGNNNYELYTLSTYYTRLTAGPVYFTMAGRINGDNAESGKGKDYIWTSTINNNRGRAVGVNQNNQVTSTEYDAKLGSPIRCVAR